ncbi:MAG TPA: SDR family oxidoreductase [Burkholderiales bacterium]|jgi:NAD(P)-dependent dehydrogenase (short-subunit alcohol dehydrogenase family)|nr:SDR family oxidoreductase [Burkholderiales bacterium]
MQAGPGNVLYRRARLEPDRAAGHRLGVSVKRLGRPEVIADAVVYLGSRKTSYLTGQIMGVNGGKTAG